MLVAFLHEGKIKMIDTILWDIDGTLMNFLEAEKAAIRKCFEIFGIGECSDEMLSNYSQINKNYWEALERGEFTKPQILVKRFEDFFDKYCLDSKYDNQFNPEKFNLEYQQRLGDTVCFYPNSMKILKTLEGKVLQCAVTNGTKVAQERKLLNSGIGKILDYVFISELVGVEKPNKEFFDRVFSKIGENRRESTIIIGDSLSSDILGGNNAGIKTCWYNPDKKSKNLEVRVDYEISDLIQVLNIQELKLNDFS